MRAMAMPPADHSVDLLPPHSLEAEQGVLGCLLTDPTECIPQFLDSFKAGEEAFYDLRHRTIYSALMAMHDSGQPIDIITVGQRLKDSGQIHGIGGISYLSGLMDSVPSSANLSYYSGIIREKHLLRRVISACGEASEKARGCSSNVDGLIDDVEASILKVRGDSSPSSNASMRDIVASTIDVLQERAKGKAVGIPTGFYCIDRIIGGLKPPSQGAGLYVIAARPSTGKTALAMNIAANVAETGHRVGVFSLEMSKESLVERMIAARGQVNTSQVRSWSEPEFRRAASASGWASKLPIVIDDREGLTCSEIKAKARRWKQRDGLALVVIDYLQLIQGRRGLDRREAVDEVSREIKNLSKELSVPVIVLAQLNREVEKEKNRKPRLSDLRESGQIEQDGDVVGMLYRADPNEDPEAETSQINLYVAKQRNGMALVDACLVFHKRFTRFEAKSPIA